MKVGENCRKCPDGVMSALRYVPPRPACPSSGMPAVDEHLVYECNRCGYEHWTPTAYAMARIKADAEARTEASHSQDRMAAAAFKRGHER